ncbi:MAG: T9SS type A sorting domain-containing protein [Saprospiraceae bacterium]|nr:T9SS type A sorting domain-containing protein [Saprospiraceae bacterium]
MKKLNSLLAFLLLATATSFSQTSLRIINPNWWWAGSGEEGTIEEAVFTVEPKGIYTEIGLYLTFSAQSLGYSNSDSVEIVFDFNLPQGAIIHDSWLWVGNVIVKADIIDRWTAIETYEDIVDRRRDPSLLYRKPDGGYQLRVFPLPGQETRKVKITWLTPTRWSAETVTTMLPTDLLKVSLNAPSKIQIVALPSPSWPNPRLSENLLSDFQPANDPVWGDILVANLDWLEITEPVEFIVDAPLQDGVFASQLDDGDGRFYQLAYLPPNLPQNNNPRKIAFLFDHENNNASFGSANLFGFLKRSLPDLLTEADSFNMFFPRGTLTVERLAEQWISGDPATVHQLLDTLENPLSGLYGLENLFDDAFDFIKDNGGSADIVLFASSSPNNAWQWETVANNILNEMDALGLDVTIHVVNFQDLNLGSQSTPEGYVPTLPHQQIYETIASETGGKFYGDPAKGGNLWETIRDVLEELTGEPAVFDLSTDLANGFTWQRYLVNYAGQSMNANRPVLQVGRYEGDFPMEIEYNLLTQSGFFSDTKTLEASQIAASDSLGREAWFGPHLAALEGGSLSDFQVQNIINTSITERVLCSYTAFLALEPNQGGEPCLACWGSPEDVVIWATEEKKATAEISLEASPNPFTDKVRIRLTFKQQNMGAGAKLLIYNAQGRMVKQFEVVGLQGDGEYELVWDGFSDNGSPLSAGIYFVIFRTESGVVSCKLVKAN